MRTVEREIIASALAFNSHRADAEKVLILPPDDETVVVRGSD
jgi:hypothetical protein